MRSGKRGGLRAERYLGEKHDIFEQSSRVHYYRALRQIVIAEWYYIALFHAKSRLKFLLGLTAFLFSILHAIGQVKAHLLGLSRSNLDGKYLDKKGSFWRGLSRYFYEWEKFYLFFFPILLEGVDICSEGAKQKHRYDDSVIECTHLDPFWSRKR